MSCESSQVDFSWYVGHQQYYLIPKLLQRLANNRAITFFWYLRPGKEGSGNILMVSRSHSQLLCIACGFFESGTRIYLGFANWRKNNSVEHVKLHQRTLLKTTIQDAELGYEETAKSIAPGVDQAKQVISANIAVLNSRDSEIPKLFTIGLGFDAVGLATEAFINPDFTLSGHQGLAWSGKLGVPEADEKI